MEHLFNLYLSQGAFGEVEVVGGVLGLAVDAGLEMEMRGRGTARLAYEGNHLPRLDALALLDEVLGVVGVVGLEAVLVADAHEVTVAREFVGIDHFTGEGGIYLVLGLRLEVDTGMHPSTALPIGTDHLGARQREVPVARHVVRIVAMGAPRKHNAQEQQRQIFTIVHDHRLQSKKRGAPE